MLIMIYTRERWQLAGFAVRGIIFGGLPGAHLAGGYIISLFVFSGSEVDFVARRVLQECHKELVVLIDIILSLRAMARLGPLFASLFRISYLLNDPRIGHFKSS